MAIFRKEDPHSDDVRAPLPTRTPNPRAEHEAARRATLVAQGTKIVGQISGTSEVLVEGVVEGQIALEGQLVIEAGGHVVGNVSARSAKIAGRLDGNVKAADRVELQPSGAIEGDVTAPRVAIAEGGFCKGKIEMRPEGVAGASPRKSAKPHEQAAKESSPTVAEAGVSPSVSR